MTSNHYIKFGHHFLVWNQFPAISRVDAHLDEGLIFGLGFGGALDRLGREPTSAAALSLGDAVNEGKRFGIDSGGNNGSCHGFLYRLYTNDSSWLRCERLALDILGPTGIFAREDARGRFGHVDASAVGSRNCSEAYHEFIRTHRTLAGRWAIARLLSCLYCR